MDVFPFVREFSILLRYFGDKFPLYKQVDCEISKNDGSNFPYLGVMLIFSLCMFLFEYYLDIRQLLKFKTVKVLIICQVHILVRI